MTKFELKDIDLEQSVVAGFMEKKDLKRKEMKDIATKEEEGYVEAHKGDDSASIPIEIPELPQVPQKKKKKKET